MNLRQAISVNLPPWTARELGKERDALLPSPVGESKGVLGKLRADIFPAGSRALQRSILPPRKRTAPSSVFRVVTSLK